MKILKKSLIITSFFTLFLLLIYGGIYMLAKMSSKLPINTANTFYFYDQNDDFFSGNNTNKWVSLNEINQHLINATIATEDKHFYNHIGFDYLRIAKSLYNNIKSGSNSEGASTITQQYAKNLFLDFDRTWERKIEEAWLTIRLEVHYSKDEILEGYLNTINYGNIFGIENASKYYFNKSAKDLTLAEASILAGIPKWPSKYSPLIDEKAAKQRQSIILDAMVKNNYITEAEKDNAYNTQLVYKSINDVTRSKMLMYYQDAVISELKNIKTIPKSFLTTGGLKIYTNLDMAAQKVLEEKIDNNLQSDKKIEVASVIMNPKNGKVLALTGGRDYMSSQYNRATQAKRQVGSTLKPFLYYSALENGFTESTTFTSEKTTFSFSENKTYTPTNYGDLYAGKQITMGAAVAYSDNIYAVKTHLFLGEENLVNMLDRVGIGSNLDMIPSLALGTEEINIMNMMTGYAVFANEGYKVEPYLIRKVEDMNGNILYEKKEDIENILNKNLVYIVNEMLSNTYNKNFIDYNTPTCLNIASKMSRKYSIKSGTTNTDNLIFGYNKDLLMGVWLGYDDNSNTELIINLHAKNIWVEAMEAILKDKDKSWYQIPKNVVGVVVDPITGKVAKNNNNKNTMFYYIKGTEPNSLDKLDSLIPTVKQKETKKKT